MKKIITFLLCAALGASALAMSACGNQTENNSTTNASAAISESKASAAESKQPSQASASGRYFEVPIIDHIVVVDVPNWQEIEHGFTQLYIVKQKKFVAVASSDNLEIKSLSEAYKETMDDSLQMMQNYFLPNEMKPEKEENVTINGTEAYHFEGKLNCGHDTIRDIYAVGYTFMMNGIPITIYGGNLDENQSEEISKEVKEWVETMTRSARPRD